MLPKLVDIQVSRDVGSNSCWRTGLGWLETFIHENGINKKVSTLMKSLLAERQVV